MAKRLNIHEIFYKAQETPGLPIIYYWVLLVSLSTVIYFNSFSVPFIADDVHNIEISKSIRRLWPPDLIFAPPEGSNIGGRPIANMTFALNYAVSGLQVWSYHLFNLLVHTLSGLCLFGIIRKTLKSKKLQPVYGKFSDLLAFVCSALWLVHPLHTEAVTYISQRFESLAGLCLLLTLYFAICGWRTRNRAWNLLAALTFLIGIGTKEVMVSAPLVIFFYDLAFVHSRPLNAIKKSPSLYGGFLFGLLLLGVLLLVGDTSRATPDPHCTWIEYLLTQSQVVVHYLRLSFWPQELCLDWNWPVADLGQTVPYALFISLLLGGSLYCLWRRKPLGFLGSSFFLILAPSSSFLPLPFLACERRMYLPLAALVVVAVCGVYKTIRLLAFRFPGYKYSLAASGLFMALLAIVSLGIRTVYRNHDYRSAVAISMDMVRKKPDNPPARIALADAYIREGDPHSALVHLKTALELNPFEPLIYCNIGIAYQQMGNYRDAINFYNHALNIKPDYIQARTNIGVTFLQIGEIDKATFHLKKGLKTNPKPPPVLLDTKIR